MKRINKWIVVLSAMCVLSAYAPAPPREDLSAPEAKLKPLIEASREANEMDRDGRFIAYDIGVIYAIHIGVVRCGDDHPEGVQADLVQYHGAVVDHGY